MLDNNGGVSFDNIVIVVMVGMINDLFWRL